MLKTILIAALIFCPGGPEAHSAEPAPSRGEHSVWPWEYRFEGYATRIPGPRPYPREPRFAESFHLRIDAHRFGDDRTKDGLWIGAPGWNNDFGRIHFGKDGFLYTYGSYIPTDVHPEDPADTSSERVEGYFILGTFQMPADGLREGDRIKYELTEASQMATGPFGVPSIEVVVRFRNPPRPVNYTPALVE